MPTSAKGKTKAVEQEACVICLEPISERAVAVPCNHCTFDFLCVASWLQDHTTCPLCKSNLQSVQYDWRSPWDFKTYLVPASKTLPESSQQRTRRRQNALHRHGPRNRQRHPSSGIASPTEAAALLRRRHVYNCRLYSLHVGSNRLAPHRDISPKSITSDRSLQRRGRMFIRRELGAFSFLSPPSAIASGDRSGTIACTTDRRAANAEFLLEYIVSVLKTVEIKSSNGKAEEMIGDFLGAENGRLFLHELAAWLRSPYEELEAWDRFVQYKEVLPRFDGDVNSIENSEKAGRTHDKSRRGVG